MTKLAFLTIGILQAPYYEPQIAPLGELLDPVWATAEASSGFVALSKQEERSGDRIWGPLTVPALFQKEALEMRLLTVLSLWENLESVFAFAYHGFHGQVFSRRKEWFVAKGVPGYVAWWVADNHTPTWQEASERYEQLHHAGSTATAFDFKSPFDAQGHLVKIDREIVKHQTAANPTSNE